MPELPEIETIRRSLAPLIGQAITEVLFSRLAPVETTTPLQIRRVLIGATLTTLRRWGKYLLLDTDRNASLVIHLGMSGRLLLGPHQQKPEGVSRKVSRTVSSEAELRRNLEGNTLRLLRADHCHMQLQFSSSSLRLIDPRRFGTISLSHQPDGLDNPFLARLGPDYLAPQLTPEIFIIRARRHPGLSLKSLLLHQGVAAGLGNIYACEALYRAQLNPRRRVSRVKNEELVKLLHAIRDCLALAIQKGGTTLRDYRDGAGRSGGMKDFLQIYGQPHAKRIYQGGRTTWFNPEVQK